MKGRSLWMSAALLLIACSTCIATTYQVGPGQTYETFADFHTSVTPDPGDVVDGGGNTFRETITPNASGEAGAPITYRNLSLNGSAVKANGDFDAHEILGPTAVLTEASGSNFNNALTYNIREEFTAGAVVSEVSTASFQFCAQSDQNWVLTGVGVGNQVADATGDLGQDRTNNIRITFSGANGVTIAAGTCVDSDQITMTGVDLRQAFVVTVFAETRYFLKTTTAHRIWWGSSGYGDQSQTLDTGYTPPTSAYGMVKAITSYSPVTIYKTTVAANPRMVWENGTALTNRASVVLCASAGSAFYDEGTTTLYVNATDGGNVITNGRVYELGNLTENIDLDGQSYIILEDITAMRTVGTTLENVGGIVLTGDHNIARRIVSHSHERHCLSHYIATNSVIEDSTIYDSYSTAPITIWDSRSDGNVIRRCTVYQSVSNNGVIVAHGGSTNTVIEDCELYGAYSGSDGHILNSYDSGTGGIVFRRNNVHGDATRAIHAASITSLDVYANLFNMTTLADTAIVLDGCTGGRVFNNTFNWTSTKYAFSSTNGTTGAEFKNNIVNAPRYITVSAGADTGFESDYNVFYAGSATPLSWLGASYSVADWITNSGQDAHSVAADPQFVGAGNFALSRTSVCRRGGINLGLGYAIAMNGFNRGPRWDVGAYTWPQCSWISWDE